MNHAKRLFSFVFCLFGVAICLMPVAQNARATENNGRFSVPHGAFHWQLQGEIAVDPASIAVIGADLDETTALQVAKWRKAGLYPVCYINVGALEDWRDDYHQFPTDVVGNAYRGWDGEYWLDIAHYERFADIMTARFDRCRQKGFLAVEPDNIDGYEADQSNRTTGFKLTREDQVRYVEWLIDLAHDRGLAIGQKNASELVDDLVDRMDFALLESAFRLGFMDEFDPYITQEKPVFAVEYFEEGADPALFCPAARKHGFQGVIAGLELDQTPQNCP